MSDNIPQTSEEIRQYLEADADSTDKDIPEAEILEVSDYPEDNDDDMDDDTEQAVEALVSAARARTQPPTPQPGGPIGYVTNARNAGSSSDTFQFWTPAEEITLGIGSLVRQMANAPGTQKTVDTYGIITETNGFTLGLDDYAIHVYEEDAQPPLDSITPAPSRRRPVVNYKTKVMAATQKVERPVLSGPVYALKASELAQVHGQDKDKWPGAEYLLLGFYEDSEGEFGIFAEERARVLGPKQGHVIFSCLPGAGKTSLFLTTIISMYAQLRELEEDNNDEK